MIFLKGGSKKKGFKSPIAKLLTVKFLKKTIITSTLILRLNTSDSSNTSIANFVHFENYYLVLTN